MRKLKWQDEYAVGVKELDDQHKSLLDIINVLIEEQQNDYDETKFSSTIAMLIHYAYTHFASEERYFEQVQLPNQKQHILEHVDFIMKTLSLAMKIEKDHKENQQELLQFLKDWYSLHVLGMDRQYIPFLLARGIK
jgi:hemerythrin-like metal-binding protein